MSLGGGYGSHEPHGYLTGDYPHGGVVTDDRAGWLGLPRGLCGFRLWRTPPGYGKTDAGVCVVLFSKASCSNRASRTQQPEARDEEGDVTGAIAPTKPLTALDLCDRCGAQAYVRVLLPNSGELLFCAHHSREHLPALKKVAIDIQDETQRLAKAEKAAE
jgi:hypothetical protein